MSLPKVEWKLEQIGHLLILYKTSLKFLEFAFGLNAVTSSHKAQMFRNEF